MVQNQQERHLTIMNLHIHQGLPYREMENESDLILKGETILPYHLDQQCFLHTLPSNGGCFYWVSEISLLFELRSI